MSSAALLTVPPTVMAVLLLPPPHGSLRLGASAESSCPYWNAGLLVVLRKMAWTETAVLRLLHPPTALLHGRPLGLTLRRFP